MSTSPHQPIEGDNQADVLLGSPTCSTAAPCIHPLDMAEHSLSTRVPWLDSVRLGVADVAALIDPLLRWQLNIRFRNLRLQDKGSCMEAIARVFSVSQPPEIRAQCTQIVTDLLSSKGVPRDIVDKAARQWCSIHGLMEGCLVFEHPLGRRSFDAEQLQELEQKLQHPDYADMREAAQVILSVAGDMLHKF